MTTLPLRGADRPKASENHRQPKNGQERPPNSASDLSEHQPTPFRDFADDLQRRRLEPPRTSLCGESSNSVSWSSATAGPWPMPPVPPPVALFGPDLADSHRKNLA